MAATFDYSFKFDGLTIIESLPDKDRPTGRELYDSVVPCAEAVRLRHEMITVGAASELLAKLDALAFDCRSQARSPIIHLEMHGRPEGLIAADGSIATWTELKGPLTRINEASRFNLMVTLGACWGEHLVKCMSPVDRSPACLVIGTGDLVWSNVLADGFKKYYQTLLATLDGAVAWRALNEVGRKDRQPFGAWPARYLFRQIIAMYFTRSLASDEVLKRVDRLCADLVARRAVLIRDGVRVRKQLVRALTDRDYWLGKFRDEFFMLDLYPENRERFSVSLDEVDATDVTS